MSVTALVLKVECGSTLKTMIGGVAVEIECGDADDGVPPIWTLPDGPSGSGGVVAYSRLVEDAPRLNLSGLAAAFEQGMSVEELPDVDVATDRMVYRDEGGHVGSLGDMVIDPE